MIVYRGPMLERIKALRDRPYLVALLVGIAAQILFTVHLDQPSRIMFDEIHYVPAAQSLLSLDSPRNVEHPMLGKELIAAGIVLLGDGPFGWRIMPSLAGTASVVAAFAFVWLLLGSMRAALVAAALTALNQTLFIQARTAMLDVFLGAFVMWALVLFLWAARGSGAAVWRRWTGASVLMGLAVAVKWAAVPYVALAGLAFVLLRLRDVRAQKRPLLAVLSGKEQRHWNGLPTLHALVLLGVVSVAVYFVTFIPAFYYQNAPITSLRGLLHRQWEMYQLQTQVLHAHTYQSDWWSWPLMIRPIWYFYEWDMGAQRGVLLIGNPLIMWGGLVAVLACLWAWLRSRAMAPLAVALLWIASLAIYIVIPKSLGFYYYYHLSGLFLCPVLAVAFHHFDKGRNRGWEEWFVAGSAVAFFYFYPIIAAQPLASADGFNYWMWLPSWR
jgi:dolichyl-phosphate-mannose-protein mannosyltransferase